MSGSYELYAEVLRRTAVKVRGGARLGDRAGALELPAEQHPVVAAVPRHERAARPAQEEVPGSGGCISNIDDKLLGATRRHFRADFDLVVTAQQVRSYKPDPAHFKECSAGSARKTSWVHIATGLYTDVIPCMKLKVPVIWINRKKEELAEGQKGSRPRS